MSSRIPIQWRTFLRPFKRFGTATRLSNHRWLFINVFVCGGTSVVADLTSQLLTAGGHRGEFALDKRRVFTFGLTSLILAPSIHFWYIFLDNVISGPSGLRLLKKLTCDAVIFSPFYILLFYCLQCIFEKRHYNECLQKLRAGGPGLWLTETVTWTPMQIVNFLCVPLAYRVMYDNAVSLSFDILYSSAYYTKNPDSFEINRD